MARSPCRAVEKYYTVGDVALLLSFSEKWVREKVRAMAFPGSVQINDDIRIPASSVNAFLDEHAVFSPDAISARTEGELRRKLVSSDV